MTTSSLAYCGKPSPWRVSSVLPPAPPRGVGRHAQVDLGIDHGQLARRLQAEARKVIERIFAVAVHAAQHQALAVVALLHADVEIAVAVAAQEELLDQLEG
jgi:hypothetical protein